MIGRLTGKILEKNAPSIILDVNGVGYEVFIPLTIFETLPSTGEECTLKIYYVKKEDSVRLYGFNTYNEKDIFVILCNVKGLGDKTVMKFFNTEKADVIRDWFSNKDLDKIKTLPSLGLKTASRVLLELSGKIISSDLDYQDIDDVALQGLISLGYTSNSAKVEIKKVTKPNMKSKDIIQEVLKLR